MREYLEAVLTQNTCSAVWNDTKPRSVQTQIGCEKAHILHWPPLWGRVQWRSCNSPCNSFACSWRWPLQIWQCQRTMCGRADSKLWTSSPFDDSRQSLDIQSAQGKFQLNALNRTLAMLIPTFSSNSYSRLMNCEIFFWFFRLMKNVNRKITYSTTYMAFSPKSSIFVSPLFSTNLKKLS